MIKHLGKQNDRKVIVVFREVPEESHMALVLYPEILPMKFQDSVMKVLESVEGQQAETLGDVMFRNLLPDGRPMLQTLHKEGMIKKVQTSQIVMTPNPRSAVRLDELNTILNEMKLSEGATERLAALDKNAGMEARNYRTPPTAVQPGQEYAQPAAQPLMAGDGALTDEAIAADMVNQAGRLKAQADAMLAEATRLMTEAKGLDPAITVEITTPAKPKTRTRKAKAEPKGESDAA